MSDLSNKNKALMRRIYEEMWNQGKPALAVEIFAQPEGVERFVRQFLSNRFFSREVGHTTLSHFGITVMCLKGMSINCVIF